MKTCFLQHHIFTAIAAANLFALISMYNAYATSHLNCGSYAGAAVSQNQRNVNQGCGFSGPRWQSDFNAHFTWCQTSTMAALTTEDRAREAQLSSCLKEKQQQQARVVYCQQYGVDARNQQQENLSFSCGYRGGRWSLNVNGHVNWCMGVNNAFVDRERHARNLMLNQCKVKVGRCTPSSDCAGYLCNTGSGQCFKTCTTTQKHCALDYVCDDGKCRHKSNYQ